MGRWCGKCGTRFGNRPQIPALRTTRNVEVAKVSRLTRTRLSSRRRAKIIKTMRPFRAQKPGPISGATEPNASTRIGRAAVKMTDTVVGFG